jgi:ribonuclease HII
VVAAALVFPSRLSPADKRLLADLDDSKAAHLNHAKRLAMASHLQTIGHWGIGEASLEDIERYNIFHASFLAGRRAIAAVAETLGTEMQAELERYIVIVDGKHRISELTLIQYPHVKADGKSAAVAGASIIAKAYRDNLLMRYAEEYPGYGWEKNAGYGTPSHQEAMQTLGLTPLHRKSFKLVQQQLTLF